MGRTENVIFQWMSLGGSCFIFRQKRKTIFTIFKTLNQEKDFHLSR